MRADGAGCAGKDSEAFVKIRLDVCMMNRGLCPSREKARNRILAGEVSVNGSPVTKPGTMIDETADIELTGEGLPFVGRGGLKLEKLLTNYRPDLTGLRCLDVGASTGGFTDAMLKRGAAIVYAVDVGTDQLADELRTDPRVVSLEQTDIRTVTADRLGGTVDFVSIDVSFVSLEKIIPAVSLLMHEGSELGVLIKPQFEAGRSGVGKHGVVRDKAVHREVLTRILGMTRQVGFRPEALEYSPICGQSGNIEYLLYAVFGPGDGEDEIRDMTVERVVNEAFLHLGK